MKILRDYILKDFIAVSIFSFLLATMVMLMGNMVQITDLIIRKGVSFFDAAKIFLYHAPVLLQYIIPISFLFGVMLVMGRLIADNELIAIRVAGISLFKILNIFLVIGAIASLFLFLLNDRVIPEYHYRYQVGKKTFVFKNVSALIEPGVFLDNFENYVLYISDKYDGNKLKNVFIYELGDESNDSNKVTFAKRGEFIREGDVLKIKLEEGFRDESSTSGDTQQLYRLNFKVFFMDLPIESKQKKEIRKKPSDMSIKELREKMAFLKKIAANGHHEPLALKKELHRRISHPFSVMVFIILGFGISLIIKHREKSINLFIASVGTGLYYLLDFVGTVLVEHRIISIPLGAWLPNMVTALIGTIIIFKYANSR
jgi:lipopolysaccharide export system permease protein